MARTRRNRKTRKLKRGGAANTFEGITFPKTLILKFPEVQPTNGQLVQRSKTVPEPMVEWVAPPPGEFRTLICVDPDAPARMWCHWLIVNADGTLPSTGETVLHWAPPTPPSGVHRYYFCLFAHSAKILEDATKERGYFNFSEFVQTNGLHPLASIFIRVKHT
jgi:phosphatidylethanolamine-binding protein (PEBP) family uncharacterized protein